MRRSAPSFQLLAIVLLVGCAVGAPARNLFHELLGKTEEETTARIEATWRQFTNGDKETGRLCYEAPDQTAYIADIGNGDVRAGGGLHFTGAVVGPHTRGSP